MDTIKFKLTDECITFSNRKLYRIEALKDFSDVEKGDKGGFVEYEDNLSQHGDCWIYDDAKVFDNAIVYGNARIYSKACIYVDARIFGKSIVYGFASVFGNIVFKNWWSSGRYFTWTRSNNMWKVGCFYGTGEELITKAYEDSRLSGIEYERIVKYVESILKDNKQ